MYVADRRTWSFSSGDNEEKGKMGVKMQQGGSDVAVRAQGEK